MCTQKKICSDRHARHLLLHWCCLNLARFAEQLQQFEGLERTASTIESERMQTPADNQEPDYRIRVHTSEKGISERSISTATYSVGPKKIAKSQDTATCPPQVMDKSKSQSSSSKSNIEYSNWEHEVDSADVLVEECFESRGNGLKKANATGSSALVNLEKSEAPSSGLEHRQGSDVLATEEAADWESHLTNSMSQHAEYFSPGPSQPEDESKPKAEKEEAAVDDRVDY